MAALTENDVVEAVAEHLKRLGYSITTLCSTQQRGVDIEAVRDGKVLRVEAKGATSSLKHTKRFGKRFDRGQIESHASRALYKALSFYGEGVEAAIALPDDALHREKIAPLQSALHKLGVTVFWVAEDCRVSSG